MSNYYQEYLWLVVVGCFLGFVYAFGIGANDVANAFASTVSSKSLTLKQAVIVAGIFELSGAILLGSAVTSTIRSKIFDPSLFAGEGDIVMLGQFTSLITATLMLYTFTYFALPVSTTQTIVGCIMGFAIAAKGIDSISKPVFIQILLSWVLSPTISGLLSYIFFSLIRFFIHQSANPYIRAYYAFPLILTIFIGIDMFFILYQGLKNNYSSKLSVSWVLPAAFGSGAFCGLIWLVIIGPIAKRRVAAKMESDDREEEAKEAKDALVHQKAVEQLAVESVGTAVEADEATGEIESHDGVTKHDVTTEHPIETTTQAAATDEKKKSIFGQVSAAGSYFAKNTYKQDLEAQSFVENKVAVHIWSEAERYDKPTEQMFTYVQVFTACLNSFAHGANDVSNAIAPISAILLIYQTGELDPKVGVQKWLLAYCGIGIVLGLLCYGYRVMKSLGYKLTPLSPSRGACAELASSLYVVTASFLEMPVSSTQCIVGAVTGVGLVGGYKNVGWWFFLRICLGWVIEFFTAIFLSAGIFSLFAYTPSLVSPTGNATATN